MSIHAELIKDALQGLYHLVIDSRACLMGPSTLEQIRHGQLVLTRWLRRFKPLIIRSRDICDVEGDGGTLILRGTRVHSGLVEGWRGLHERHILFPRDGK